MAINRNQYKSLTESVMNAVDPLSEMAQTPEREKEMRKRERELRKGSQDARRRKAWSQPERPEFEKARRDEKRIEKKQRELSLRRTIEKDSKHIYGTGGKMLAKKVDGEWVPVKEAVAMGDPNRGGEGRKKPIVPPGIDPYGMVKTTLGKTHKRLATLGSKDKTRYYQNIGMRSRAASRGGKTGRLYPMYEEVNPTVAAVSEAILAGDSARRSMLLRRKKEAQKIMTDRAEAQKRGWLPPVAKMITDVPLTVDPKKRLKTRQTDKRGIVAIKKPDFATPEDAVKHNTKMAHDIIAAIHSKPHGTPVNLYGRKRGEGTDTKERKVRVSKKRIMGQDVHVIHGTDRQVHLNPSGAGLQVIDAKTKRIILDRGNDADW